MVRALIAGMVACKLIARNPNVADKSVVSGKKG